MPEISRFYGIVIRMFFNDHVPPHFHAIYGEESAVISIENLAVLEGHLTARALGLVVEWATLHRAELMDRWDRARRYEPLRAIEPLR
jgi:hypothetical protein